MNGLTFQPMSLEEMTPDQRKTGYAQLGVQVASYQHLQARAGRMLFEETPDGSPQFKAGWVGGLDLLINWLDGQLRGIAGRASEFESFIKKDELSEKLTKSKTEFKALPAAPVKEPVIVASHREPCIEPSCITEVGRDHEHVVFDGPPSAS